MSETTPSFVSTDDILEGWFVEESGRDDHERVEPPTGLTGEAIISMGTGKIRISVELKIIIR